MPFTIQEKPDGLTFNVRVQPRSSKNKVAGIYDDALKINLTAPPVDNAANKACAAFLAKLLSVPKSTVTIISGHTGRNKQVLVHCPKAGGDRDSIRKVIMAWVST
jgi:uncharacterized protein (TIGR00251 family)